MSTNPYIPQTLQAPIQDQLILDGKILDSLGKPCTITGGGMAAPILQQYYQSLNRVLLNLVGYNIQSTFGATGNGITDDTNAFAIAIMQVQSKGGGVIILPPGTYNITSFAIPYSSAAVTLMGAGDATVIKGYLNAPAGAGRIDVFGSNVTFLNMLFDGGRTAPVGLAYNRDFLGMGGNDPMANSLTQNTSVWLHGPVNDILFQEVNFTHTAGYGILIDAYSGGISSVDILNCRFNNNYPNTFGLVGGSLVYGSWTGGIYVNGDGRAANPGRVVSGLYVQGCRFLRNAGNCIWSHLYALDELHSDFRFIGNYFQDCGLDGILYGGVSGGACVGNVFHRVGYVCTDDTSSPVPRWLPNLQATALDSGGIVKGVLYANNTFTSINGGCIDLDGHGLSVIANNVMRTPYPDEPEYVEDQIANTGPNNNDPSSYGVNLGSTNQTKYGATDITISGNTIINLPQGSLKLFAARRVFATGNNIIAPANSAYPPIGMGPTGPNPNQRCYGNRISANNIDYNPAVAAPAIYEDSQFSAFLGSESNAVFGNNPLTPSGTLAFEFQKAPASGSVVYLQTVWFS